MDDVLGRDGDGVMGDEMRCVLLCCRHPYSGWGYAMSDGWLEGERLSFEEGGVGVMFDERLGERGD